MMAWRRVESGAGAVVVPFRSLAVWRRGVVARSVCLGVCREGEVEGDGH